MIRSLLTASPLAISIVQNGRIVFVNPPFEKLTGYTEDELIGEDLSGIIVAEDMGLARERMMKALNGERLSPYELRIRSKEETPDGSWK